MMDDAAKTGDLREALRERADLRVRVANAEAHLRRIQQGVTAEERAAVKAAQMRADSVAALFGDRVSEPRLGEMSLAYRRRLLRDFLQHSPQLKNARIDNADPATLGLIENQVYADAASAARTAAEAKPGILSAHVETDSAGRRITKFHGDMMAWLAPFAADGARCKLDRKPE